MSKMALILRTFCWIQQNISSSLGKIFKSICKVLFGSFRKYYGLPTLEVPLAKFQRLKMQDFGIPLVFLLRNLKRNLAQFFVYHLFQILKKVYLQTLKKT